VTNFNKPGLKTWLRSAAAVAAVAVASTAHAGGYTVTPLVTDDQAVLATLGYGPAPTTDPALVNPWDFANSGTGPWVIANAGGNGSGIVAGTATSYSGTGQIASPTITIPQAVGPAQGGTIGPVGATGDVYAAGAGFTLPGGAPAQYIFDNLDGSISGWDGVSNSAQTMLAGRGPGGNLAAYTGLELDTYNGQNLLYAANNITGNIDVFNTALAPVTLPGAFVDPGPNPDGLTPYNIQALSDGHLWVTYAVPGPTSSAQPLGSGFVDEFNTDGTFVKRFATGGLLDSPWGVVIAPSDFGAYSNDVLIGNFNDDDGLGYITAYDPNTGAYLGTLDENGAPIVLPGLWALQFGSGGQSGPTNELYFTAGIGTENHGLFGQISAVPEPGTWALALLGLAAIGVQLRQRRRLAV
jgi:uncharacterized protein (TIGR03118 family)